MGARVGNQCFATVSDASDYYYSQQLIIPVDRPGSVSYAIFQKKDDVWFQISYLNGNQFTQTKAPTLYFPQCNPVESFNAGAKVGLALVSVWILIWGYRQIGKFFDND